MSGRQPWHTLGKQRSRKSRNGRVVIPFAVRRRGWTMSAMQLVEQMTIASGALRQGTLEGSVVVVTGAGGGIGLEATRSLLWLGACVVVAEIDEAAGRQAEARLVAEWPPERVLSVPTDVGDQASVERLRDAAESRFGKVDVVLNNATFAPAGTAVVETPVDVWDRSYVVAFTIGPGLVPTRTATEAVKTLAPRLGMTVEQFWAQNSGAVLSVEAAGAGFAAATALAGRYAGQEISSSQALIDAGIPLESEQPAPPAAEGDLRDAVVACEAVRKTLAEQLEGWRQRSFFERQWIQRDFKRRVGMPAERCLETLVRVGDGLTGGDAAGFGSERVTLERLAAFYGHLGELASGYVKDPQQREDQLRVVASWKAEVERLIRGGT